MISLWQSLKKSMTVLISLSLNDCLLNTKIFQQPSFNESEMK